MYIEKRWLAPVALSLFALGTVFTVVLLLLGPRLALPAAAQSPGQEGRPQPVTPEEVVDIQAQGSQGTQITTRGFGDVGLQFKDVTINAPITIVHVSNEGNNNSTNAPVGDSNRITSEQEDLQSNRP